MTLPELERRLKPEVDKKIWPLVRALILNGIRTDESCEGHLDKGNAYPWVAVKFSYVDPDGTLLRGLKELVMTLGRWISEGKDRQWILFPIFIPLLPSLGIEPHVILFLQPKNENEEKSKKVLQGLQEEAQELAEFFNNH